MFSNIFRHLARLPVLRRLLWRRWYNFLARRFADSRWTFMNYGYLATGDGPLALEHADEPDRYCIQLYNHTVSTAELAGRDVLEIGSGRGGGASYLHRYLRPASTVGVDYSRQAITFCQATHRAPGLSFRQGDAEALPFDDNTFDVVVNVESSHCYGSMPAFLGQVARVLRPGGYFCFADLRAADDVATLQAQLAASGLDQVLEEDISNEVVRAMEADSQRKQDMIQQFIPRLISATFSNFAGVRESKIWSALATGRTRYLRCVLHKAPV